MQKMGQVDWFQTSLCFLKKLYIRQKQMAHLSYSKNKLYEILDYWSRDMLNLMF